MEKWLEHQITSRYNHHTLHKNAAPNELEDKFKKYDPHDMTIPFTADEIEKAARSLKNNKSTGIDNIKAELI